MRFVFRFLSAVSLGVAILIGVFDAVRLVSVSSVVMFDMREVMRQFDPAVPGLVDAAMQSHIKAKSLRDVVEWILLQPASVVFLVVALLFWMVGYRRLPAHGHVAR